MASRHQTLFAEGGAPWSVKRYKESTLTKMLADLSALERRGLEDNECDKVRNALNRAYNIVAIIPDDHFFYKSFWEELREFRNFYDESNGVPKRNPDAIKRRREAHDRMVIHRRKMWNKFSKISQRQDRDEQLDMMTDIERRSLDEMHLAFKSLTEEHTDLFPSLGAEIRYYEKVISKYS